METFTVTQRQRLRELNANEIELRRVFANQREREEAFNTLSKNLVKKNKQRLRRLRDKTKRPVLRLIGDKLVQAAVSKGFVELVTPIIISRRFIHRMGITTNHPLWRQIFWIDQSKCLRPMLAPNLYLSMRKLLRFWKPVKIFEIGPCFRRSTKGQRHLEEFTMFNIVELAPQEDASKRLKEMISYLMEQLGLSKYRLQTESSDVYGSTTDIIVNRVEVASAAVGPNLLDENWGIIDPWAGIGFGVERLAMIIDEFSNVTRVGRSCEYLDGARLNVI